MGRLETLIKTRMSQVLDQIDDPVATLGYDIEKADEALIEIRASVKQARDLIDRTKSKATNASNDSTNLVIKAKASVPTDRHLMELAYLKQRESAMFTQHVERLQTEMEANQKTADDLEKLIQILKVKKETLVQDMALSSASEKAKSFAVDYGNDRVELEKMLSRIENRTGVQLRDGPSANSDMEAWITEMSK